jgi:hypothetical protein
MVPRLYTLTFLANLRVPEISQLSSPAQAGDPVLTNLDGDDTAQETRLWLLDAPPSPGMTIEWGAAPLTYPAVVLW